jgi:cardiolipin synthase A/B
MSPKAATPSLAEQSFPEIDPAQPQQVSVAGHDLTIYMESRPLIEAMVEDIGRAHSRVWVESYIFLDDAAGKAVALALQERARAGLDVRVMVDAIGSQTTPWSFFRELERAGARVHIFHSFWEALWSLSAFRILNRRNHRKLMVIDDTVAYFGGMNLADPVHVSATEKTDKVPASTGWRDVHVRLTGPQQMEVAESFKRSWRLAHKEQIKRRSRAYRLGVLAAGVESIQFFDSGPGLRHTRAGRIFARLFKRAGHTLTLSMAYFLPVGRVLRALLRAHRRGVFIRVVVPGESDVPIVQSASRWLYTKLIRRRFHIYERQFNMLHSKVMVIDDQWSVVGSCNLDARSLWINLEFLAVIHSPKFAQALNAIIAHEMERSRRITIQDCFERRWWQRLIDRLAWAFRWWL